MTQKHANEKEKKIEKKKKPLMVKLGVSISDNLLSTAQSYPSLTNSNVATSNTLTTTQTMANMTSLLSQALTRSLPSTSSESDEFLETCRATTLLAELEDEEDLPEPDDDDDENDDENEDDDDYEDVMVRFLKWA